MAAYFEPVVNANYTLVAPPPTRRTACLRLLILLLLLMSCNVYPNHGPVFSCQVCTESITWLGRLVQCCTCSKWVHLKCSLLSFSKFKTLGSSHSWSCPCCIPASAEDITSTNTVTSFSDSSSLYTSTVQAGPSGPPLLIQHSRLTLAFKPLVSLPPICIFSLSTLTTNSCSWLSLYTFYSLSPLNPSEFFNGILEISEPGALNFYTFFRLIPLTLFVSRILTLTHLPLSGFLDSLLCVLIAPTPRLAFSLQMPRTPAVSSFSSGRAYPFLNFVPPLFLCLTPTLSM